tara:strand:- start:944 stop:1105 length:162 start_codon:yes stop_codon:yes gene_type:complete
MMVMMEMMVMMVMINGDDGNGGTFRNGRDKFHSLQNFNSTLSQRCPLGVKPGI